MEQDNKPQGAAAAPDAVAEDRRAFLSSAGKFALLVPPTMTFLLSTTLASDAIAQSGHCSGSHGHRRRRGDCDDDHDGNEDGYRDNNANTYGD